MLLGAASEIHKAADLGLVRNAIERAQVTDVTEGRAALTRLHAVHLGRRAQQPLRDLLHRQAALITQRPEQGAKLPPANRRTAHFPPWRSLPSAFICPGAPGGYQRVVQRHRFRPSVSCRRYMPVAHEPTIFSAVDATSTHSPFAMLRRDFLQTSISSSVILASLS